MAIYRFSAQVIGRSAGRSSTAAAAYRAGVEVIDQRTGVVHDYTRRAGVEEAFILVPEDAPEWVADRSKLWNAVELGEKRKDAQVCREVQLALPAELSADQRRELVTAFCRDQFTARGMVADVALHAPDKEGDQRNHHAHVLLTLRGLDDAGAFGPKVREWNDKAALEGWREAWQEHANRALERAGVAARIDHRSLTVQRDEAVQAVDVARADALDRAPEPKLGPVASTDLRRAQRVQGEVWSDRAAQWQATKAENAQRRGLLARVREGWRELATDGAKAFTARFERVQHGMDDFRQRFGQWVEQQAEQKRRREIEARLRLEQEQARRAAQERAAKQRTHDDGRPSLGM